MEKEKVLKIIKNVWLIIATALSVIFITVCIIGGVKTHKEKNQPKGASACVEYVTSEVVNIDRHYGVIYDENTFSITLSPSECLYSFDNLDEYLTSNHNAIVRVQYNGNNYTFDDVVNPSSQFGLGVCVSFVYGSDYFLIGDASNYDSAVSSEYYFNILSNENLSTPNFSVTLTTIDDYYSSLVSAIESDIQANEINVNDSVFETLTSSTVGFIGTISSGITSMIAVFYSDNALTVIGTLSVIVVAVSLAYFLFRLIIGLIRMRG